MIEPRIVRRYAAALFARARNADIIDRIESDLGLVSFTLTSCPDLMDAMTSPVVPAEKKHAIIKGVFGGKVHEITLSYLDLLVSKRREEAAAATESEFVDMANEARGIVDADVTTAVQMSEEQELALRAKLSVVTGKNVQIKLAVDPGMIGGVEVRIGDRVIDGSIRGQLAALREQLLS